MFHSFSEYLRPRGTRRPSRGALRLMLSFALALVLPLAASAYTVVLRGGRRVEIPSKFSVTRTTLTYEVAEGINVTLQMSSIDIAATERANNEPSGSLLARAAYAVADAGANAAQSSSGPPQRAQRTVTNRELEASRRAREASEAAYEKRRRELGLPSLEESRRRLEEEAERARASLARSANEEEQSEAYWRAQASELRGHLAALDAQIDYVRGLLSQYPDRPTIGSYTVLTSVVPLSGFGRAGFPFVGPGHAGFINQNGINIGINAGINAGMNAGMNLGPALVARAPLPLRNPNVYVAPNAGPQLRARVGFGGGATRGQVFLNSGPGGGGFRRPFIFPFGAFGGPLTVVTSNYPDYSYAEYDRDALLARLRELELERAGLQARWRVLEDEARRAGALPGWLRP